MNKKTIIALIALVVVAALVVGIYFATRPKKETTDPTKETNTQTDEGANTGAAGNSFTMIVKHGDGTEREFLITTTESFLAQALINEGIINGEGLETGMYFTVDGETASWEENQSYWAIYIGDEYANYGLNDIIIEDDAVYKLVYTIG